MDKVRYTSQFYYQLAVRLWVISMGLVLISPLVLVTEDTSTRREATNLLIILTIAAVITLPKRSVLALSIRAEELRRQILDKKITYKKPLLLLVGLFALGEFALRMARLFPSVEEISLPLMMTAGGVLIVVAIVAVRALSNNLSEQARIIEERRTNPLRWVEGRNLQIFIVGMMPIGFALVLALGSILELMQGADYSAWLYFATALLILMASRPEHDYFVTLCKRCGRSTSRALERVLFCPRCSPHVFFRPPSNIPSPGESAPSPKQSN